MIRMVSIAAMAAGSPFFQHDGSSGVRSGVGEHLRLVPVNSL